MAIPGCRAGEWSGYRKGWGPRSREELQEGARGDDTLIWKAQGEELVKRMDGQVRGEGSVMGSRAKGVADARGTRTEAHGAGAGVGDCRKAASADG